MAAVADKLAAGRGSSGRNRQIEALGDGTAENIANYLFYALSSVQYDRLADL
jgi:hypothetical protein